MKLFAATAVALLLALPGARAQQNPDDQYVIVYTLIQQGDTDVNAGQPQQALQEYREAQQELQRFQQVYGDWNPTIVNFRLKYLAEKIAALAPQSSPVAHTPPPAPAPTASPADMQSQIASLNAQIQQLQSDDATLQAKLKEALSVQPAGVSPDALAQMQQQLQQLAKENELLKATATSNAAPQNNPQLQQALAEQTARANQLAQENQSLQTRVQSLTTGAQDAEALRQENALLKKEMANMNSTSGTASGNNLALTQENQDLRARVQALTTDANAAEALREENAVLKRQLASASAAPAGGNPAQGGNLAMAQEQAVQFQAEETADWLERKALESRIQEWQRESVSGGAADTTSDEANLQSQVRELTQERDNLLAELGEANKKLYGHNNQTAAQQIDILAQQVEALRARVAVDEAAAVPYTAQELALFAPAPITPNPDAEKKSIRELPGGAAVLVAEAQSYYTNGQYGQAAADYEKILKSDANNPLALANLAAIELEENKLADADQHIQAAVAQTPNDAYNLTILGRIKFSEEKYDDALDALDHASKLDPQSAEIENFLGVALAEKGMRAQAETAFRKAILIQPDYADAHKNLAIVYLSAHPPEIELARWHYEKALASGMPPNVEFEKMLNGSGPASPQ